MQKTIRLSLDNPCHEHWDQMTPGNEGRFCGSCQKTVVDFTSMDDHQLLQWFAQHQGSVCGRLLPDQLDRPLFSLPEKGKTPNLARVWRYLIAGLLFSSEASAQMKPDSLAISQHLPIRPQNRQLMGKLVPDVEKPVDSVRGRLVDKNGRPISYATVTYGPNRGVVADENGQFAIPGDKISPHHPIKISAIGYNTIDTDVDQLLTGNPMGPSLIVMGERVEVLGGVGFVIVHKKRKPIADTVSLFKDTLASIGLAKPALKAYPNPVARGASITLSARLDQPGKYTIQLLNSSGALIETREVDRTANPGNIALPISTSLVPGIYFVKLSHPALAKCYTQEIVVF